MAKYKTLYDALSLANENLDGVLDITEAVSTDGLDEVKQFFAEVLSATTLELQQLADDIPLIDFPADGVITVQGHTAAFGLPGVALTLVFSEGENGELGYSTSALLDEGIPIGELAEVLAALQGVPIPAAVEGAVVTEVEAGYEPKASIAFSFLTELETDAKNLSTNLLLEATKEGEGPWQKSLTGTLFVNDFEFEMSFGQGDDAKTVTATLRPGELAEANLTDVVTHFVDFPPGTLPDLTIGVENAFVSFTKPDGGKKGTVLFGIGLGAGMRFGSGIPLVGPMLDGQDIAVEAVLFTYATAKLPKPDLKKLNFRLPQGKPHLPEIDLEGGIGISVSMAFGKVKQFIALPLAEQDEGAPADEPTSLTVPEKPGKWFAVNKQLGPLRIDKVGVNFKESILTFGLEASLALGPLTLTLEELTIGSRLDRFDPQFGLRGFGLGWSGGPVEISGFFLRKPTDEFFGAALIKTPKLTLKAIGAFKMENGEPSFYIYAYLGYPIGGPAFFFVEGLAAGFGFNRSVRVPDIADVAEFPLVAMATDGPEKGKGAPFLQLAQDMADGDFVPIDIGKLFLAVGVRFTTFKQLDSFLLLVATLGDSYFRLDLLGLSKLTVPAPMPGPPKPPLAEIELAIKGTFAPVEGYVGVQAQLTKNSYILSKDCMLTGGFAFFTWFAPHEQAGDFVISVGGYHPQFKRPAHYPVVPRLGFNWQVSSTINVKGGMYFALTPTVLMAGGRLEATYRSGGLKAWFIIGADFIIGWQPYFYDARMYVTIGASYTFWFFGKQTISMDIGADLHIWGPEFSGTATIDLGIIDFTVEFGAGTSQQLKHIRFSEFEKTYLLPRDKVISLACTGGLVKEIEGEDGNIWVVNPKEFALSTDSTIPSNEIMGLRELKFGKKSIWMSGQDELFPWLKNDETQLSDEVKPSIPFTGVNQKSKLIPDEIELGKHIGIGTVGVRKDELSTIHSVTIHTDEGADVTDNFLFEPITKSYPAALWGDQLKPDKNDEKRVIPDLLSGVKIKPKLPAEPDQMGYLDQAEFAFDRETVYDAFRVEEALSFTPPTAKIEEKLAGENQVRTGLLATLGLLDEAFELDVNTDFGFTETPMSRVYDLQKTEDLIPR